MEEKNFFQEFKKEILIILVGIIILIGGYFVYSKYFKNYRKNSDEEVKKEEVKLEFGDLTPFIREDLNDNEKEELKNILSLLPEREAIAKNILDDYYKNGKDMMEAYIKVDEMEKKCLEKLDKFIKEDKKQDLKDYFDNRIEEMESYYVEK